MTLVGDSNKVSLRKLDPHAAYLIASTDLQSLTPRISRKHLIRLRRGFAAFIAHANRSTAVPTTWQDAWNLWTGATTTTTGRATFLLPNCPDCTDGFNQTAISRNIGRTGNPMTCGTCFGTGEGTTINRTAHHAHPEQPATP